MSETLRNIARINHKLPEQVQLIAVSKTYPSERIMELYNAGYRIFGENRPQELKEKYAKLPKDIKWHMIGNLQKNKVKYIAPFVSLIHSIDSIELLRVVNKEGGKNERIIPCLLELKVAQEETKHGMSYEEARILLNDPMLEALENIRIVGIMGMATYTEDTAVIQKEFKILKSHFDKLKIEFFAEEDTFKELSMGMSGDYLHAIEAGSTMIRIGSSIFGKR